MNARLRIAHYELLDPIGRDGASEILRARDLRLERDVAIKLLRPDAVERPGALERFRREARIASLVSHPHICAVHDSGDEGGQPFLVLELLEGQPLNEALQGGSLPLDRSLDIAIQISDALVAAHRRLVIHGNLKPSNVFVTSDGHVKLLGLGASGAAAAEPAPPLPSGSGDTTAIAVPVQLGAPDDEFVHAYVAPEQLQSGRADPRADIFAVGALLYELTTGRRAFGGDDAAATAAAILTKQPPRPRSIDRRIPSLVERITWRALAKAPDARYASASELLAELRRARRALDSPLSVNSRASGRTLRRTAAVAVVVLAAVAAHVGLKQRWWGPAHADERSTIVVGHIANGTADPDFDGTLREALIVYLGQSPYLDLVTDDRIRATLQMMGRPDDTRLTHDVVREVCQRLGLAAMLEGSVSAVGRALVVSLAATDCDTGETIARQQREVDRKEDVLQAMGALTGSVRGALGESGGSLARHNVPIEEATTPSLDALKAFTLAAGRRAAGAELEAIPFLERAIALDPRFALAYTTLSTIYGGLGENSRSEEYARLAYEHRAHVSERERLFITSQYHDRSTGDQIKARETLEVWKRTYPRDYRPANALAVLLNRFGDYDGAAREAEEAIRRNPAHPFPYSNLAYAHRGAGRYDQARTVAQRMVERGIETLPTRRLLYQLAEVEGDAAAARVHLEWAAAHPRGFDITGARAQVEAYRGRMSEARRLYRETVDAASRQGLAQVGSGYAAQAALTEALYGYPHEALAWGRDVLRSTSSPVEPRLRAAAALALAGAPGEAEVPIRAARDIRPQDTLLHGAYLPIAESALHMAAKRHDRAIDVLRAAARYDRGFVSALVPAYLRGEARLASGAAKDAAEDFRTVLSHRGADPFSPVLPLAQRGLARALAAIGDDAGSRTAYGELFEVWERGDSDLPLLAEARRGFADLRK